MDVPILLLLAVDVPILPLVNRAEKSWMSRFFRFFSSRKVVDVPILLLLAVDVPILRSDSSWPILLLLAVDVPILLPILLYLVKSKSPELFRR